MRLLGEQRRLREALHQVSSEEVDAVQMGFTLVSRRARLRRRSMWEAKLLKLVEEIWSHWRAGRSAGGALRSPATAKSPIRVATGMA